MPIVPDAQAPAGGISSSATDLATWVQSQLGGGTLGDVMTVAAAALDATLTPHMQSHPWRMSTSRRVSTASAGRSTSITRPRQMSHSVAFSHRVGRHAVLLPSEGLGIVVLTNGSPTGVAEALRLQRVEHVRDRRRRSRTGRRPARPA